MQRDAVYTVPRGLSVAGYAFRAAPLGRAAPAAFAGGRGIRQPPAGNRTSGSILRLRWLVVRIVLQVTADAVQVVAQLLELAAQGGKQAVLGSDSGIERLHGAVDEREAHFEFGQALVEGVFAHAGTQRRPSTAAAGSTYLTS